ncbi:MAG: vanadium-dependent haloperoxidase, partial [Pseudomonadota bacterium]
VHFHMLGSRSYELNDDILNSSALQRVFTANGTYLCPQAFIEGSPTHPSYPAGHATIAGACVTVLKAFFNEDFVLSDNVEANDDGTALIPYTDSALTLGGELNKLANNVSLGRDAAGVHYRQDGIQGLIAGEQQAIAYLQDQTRTYNEDDFGGFTLTKFDGSTINIRNSRVSQV